MRRSPLALVIWALAAPTFSYEIIIRVSWPISLWARYEPPPPLGIFEDFWTPCYMTIHYLLVCTQNIEA